MEDLSRPEQLYALPPEQFTAARDAAAKQAKADGEPAAAKSLSALRRPSVAAWLVNRLARERTDLLAQLLEIGPALAAAQAAGAGEELRALGEQRRQLVQAVVEQAAADADREVSATVRGEVAGTLEAALADPASADAVRSGLLVRAVSFAGFGGVDLEGAVAAPVQTPAKPRKAPTQKAPDPDEAHREVEAAERVAHEAAGALDDAVRRCEEVERDRVRAQEASAAARARVEQLEGELAAAQERRAEVGKAAEQAQRGAARALDEVEQAQAAAEQARTALDRLRRA